MTDYSSQPQLPGEVDGKLRALPAAPVEPRQLHVVSVAQPQPTDVLSIAKRRLAAIEAELAAYKSKQDEASMLRRMIEAAEVGQ